jgi:hypothetical protein
MENRREPVKSKALALVDKLPALTPDVQSAGSASVALSVKKEAQPVHLSSEVNPQLPKYKSWEWESAQNEKPVKILSYMGSLPNQFGNDGDFYVDEMTNMLYGPKKDGVWPENGVIATGLCKRTWIAFTRMRVPSKRPERRIFVRFKAILRFLLPFKHKSPV